MTCKSKYDLAKRAAEAAAASLGLRVTRADVDAGPYTFMACNNFSISRLSHGRSSSFPAYLTSHGAVSKTLIDLMRPMFNSGVKPETFSKMILELQTKRHVHRNLEYEHELTIKRGAQNFPKGATLELFSSFGDRTKYAGRVPCGGYFGSVYKPDFTQRSHLLSRLDLLPSTECQSGPRHRHSVGTITECGPVARTQ